MFALATCHSQPAAETEEDDEETPQNAKYELPLVSTSSSKNGDLSTAATVKDSAVANANVALEGRTYLATSFAEDLRAAKRKRCVAYAYATVELSTLSV